MRHVHLVFNLSHPKIGYYKIYCIFGHILKTIDSLGIENLSLCNFITYFIKFLCLFISAFKITFNLTTEEFQVFIACGFPALASI